MTTHDEVCGCNISDGKILQTIHLPLTFVFSMIVMWLVSSWVLKEIFKLLQPKK